jgi:hypothetical protein
MNSKEFWRKRSWPNRDTSLIFMEIWRQTHNISFRIVDVPAEIRIEHLLNMSLVLYRYANPLGRAMPWLKRLVAGFPPRKPGFDPRSGHVGFVVDKVALGQIFSEYFGFPCQSSFHRLLHNHHRSSGAGTIGQQWLTYQVDSVSPHPEKPTKPSRSCMMRMTFLDGSRFLSTFVFSFSPSGLCQLSQHIFC